MARAGRVKAADAGELRQTTTLPFDVVSNPEFLKEGAAIDDFMRPDRVVIGADDERSAEIMKGLVCTVHPQRQDRSCCSWTSRAPNLTKYANAMLATRISFHGTSLPTCCEKVGADIELVRKGIGSDPRIGYQFLYAGTGYGGSCFPKDVNALIATAENAGVELGVLTAVAAANKRQKHVLVDKVSVRRFETT